MNGPGVTEAGVDALVERLHRDGVAAGREEAERLIETARAEAEALVIAARAECDRLHAEAERETEALRHASEAALDLALRDTLLRAREALTALLADRLGAHVDAALADPALLAELIGCAARRMTGSGPMVAQIGGDAVSDKLDRLAEMLRRDLADQAPALHLDGTRPGIALRREGEGLSIELTDETLTAFLFAQLQPRFRRIFEGGRLG